MLDAFYGGEPTEHALGRLAGVAVLTETARRRNRSRAARRMHEPIEATVRWLAATTATDVRATFRDVREEAGALVEGASARYLRARSRGASLPGPWWHPLSQSVLLSSPPRVNLKNEVGIEKMLAELGVMRAETNKRLEALERGVRTDRVRRGMTSKPPAHVVAQKRCKLAPWVARPSKQRHPG